jgi:hypothetical protein
MGAGGSRSLAGSQAKKAPGANEKEHVPFYCQDYSTSYT